MPGLQEAFDRIGAALEHHLESSHAAGAALAVTDREEILGVAVRGIADVAAGTPVRPETRFQIGSISKSFAGIVALQEADAGPPRPARERERDPAVARPARAVRPDHAAPPDAAHGGSRGRRGGRPDAGRRALAAARQYPPTTAAGGAVLVLERRVEDRRRLPRAGHRHADPRPARRAALRPARHARLGRRDHRSRSTSAPPSATSRPGGTGLRSCATRCRRRTASSSNTADGSITSDVIDMGAYARLLLARGDVPDGRGGRILSDAMFSRLADDGVDDGEGGPYAYGLWQEDVDGHRWIAHSGGMVGYTALLAVVPDEGLGAVILQNGGGDKHGSSRPRSRRSARASRAPSSPRPGRRPRRPRSRRPPSTSGATRATTAACSRSTRSTTAWPSRSGPSTCASSATLSRPSVGDAFLVAHDALDRFPLRFARDGDGSGRRGVPRADLVPR